MNNPMFTRNGTRGQAGFAATLAVVFGLALGSSACDINPLTVNDPENLTPEDITDPDQLPGRFNGILAEFQESYVGTGNNNIDRLLSTTALLSDEFISTGTFNTRTSTDARRQDAPQQGNTADVAFLGIHQARRQAKNVGDFIANEISESDPRITEARNFQGYTYLAIGENFCAPQPFSEATAAGPGEAGQPLNTSQIFQTAADIFDQALAANPQSNWAKVGKGRALLNDGQFQAAAQAVSDVPTNFVKFIEHSTTSTRQEMPLFDLQDVGRFSIGNNEGSDGEVGFASTSGNGLDFLGAEDPRVPYVQENGGSFLSGLTFFWQLRYPTRESDFVLADGIEARLIEAEFALNDNRIGDWLGILNDLRANVQGLMAERFDPPSSNIRGLGVDNPTAGNDLDPLSDPGTQEERVDLMFRERALWLFLSNHRLGDLRRLVRQYGRSVDDVYPSGAYHKNGTYESDVNLPVDFDESNNPNFDVSSCDVTAP